MAVELYHLRAPLNRYTFKSPKIKRWVEEACEGVVLNLFAGITYLDVLELRNDIRKEMPAAFHMDALEFVKWWPLQNDSGFFNCGKEFGTVLLDPPYSYRKSMEMYDGAKSSAFNQVKNYLPDILVPHGRVITLGYHSVSMGKSRGFELKKVCVISHGGAIHDTIISVEDMI